MKSPFLLLSVLIPSCFLCHATTLDILEEQPVEIATTQSCDCDCESICSLKDTIDRINAQQHAIVGCVLSMSAEEGLQEQLAPLWETLSQEIAQLHQDLSSEPSLCDDLFSGLKISTDALFEDLSLHPAYTEASESLLAQFDSDALHQSILNLLNPSSPSEESAEMAHADTDVSSSNFDSEPAEASEVSADLSE